MTGGGKARARLLERLAADERLRQAPGHPPAARLMAYLAGELPAGQVDEIEEHLALCRPCVQILSDLRGFRELMDERGEEAPGGAPRPTEADTEASWQALRARLAPELAMAERPTTALGIGARFPATAGPFRRIATSPATVYGLAAALLVSLVAVPLWIAARGARPPAPLLLYLPGSEVTRGPGETGRPLVVDLAKLPALLVLPLPAGPAFAAYRIDVLTPDGHPRLSLLAAPGAVAGSVPGTAGEPRYLTLALSPRTLAPGEYRLRVLGWRDGHGEALAEHALRIAGG